MVTSTKACVNRRGRKRSANIASDSREKIHKKNELYWLAREMDNGLI